VSCVLGVHGRDMKGPRKRVISTPSTRILNPQNLTIAPLNPRPSSIHRIVERYMDHIGGGTFRFKAGYNSEVELTKIVEREGSCIGYKSKEELLYGLRTFVNNVVLLRDDNRPNDYFYPRIEVWKTSSFQEMGGDPQHKIRGLYQSYYYGRQDQYWADTALDKLPPLLDASSMMVSLPPSLPHSLTPSLPPSLPWSALPTSLMSSGHVCVCAARSLSFSHTSSLSLSPSLPLTLILPLSLSRSLSRSTRRYVVRTWA
jgi:hypothetical protein